ncbi:MAG: YitT family protein [Lachnospiraceae bacterium]|nr:YitT family protein [Lachnospiraceae bacterium]
MKYLNVIKEYLIITLASVVYSVGIALFLDPNNLAPGGVSGLAIILNRLVPLQVGTLMFLLNIPIFVLGIWKLGARVVVRSVYCLAVSSVMINYMSANFSVITRDKLLAALSGAVLMGVGIGVVMKQNATTGGMDIVIKVLRRKYPQLKTNSLFLMTDIFVVALSAVVFRDIEAALYAAVTVVMNSIVLDIVLYGRDEAKLLYIISDYSGRIADRVLKELDIGLTYVHGRGGYSGRDKEVLMVVMHKNLLPRAEEIVKQEDPEAFMIVTSANEIYGEGYKNIFSERL